MHEPGAGIASVRSLSFQRGEDFRGCPSLHLLVVKGKHLGPPKSLRKTQAGNWKTPVVLKSEVRKEGLGGLETAVGNLALPLASCIASSLGLPSSSSRGSPGCRGCTSGPRVAEGWWSAERMDTLDEQPGYLSGHSSFLLKAQSPIAMKLDMDHSLHEDPQYNF
ncbi:cytochrome b5 isoform X5 [Macaca fascicularis]|uniref:cytochrome b5 isoform X5 n=1 Tax=Macaca fascicularis TaxID=9541 RepID=UPI003D15E092